MSDSDSESDDRVEDALEEIDFADLAQIRAEVDAIAQSTTAIALDIHDAQGDIEEVDFADLGAIRAQVDALKPQATSRNDVLEEVFTGVYNHARDGSGTMDGAQKNEPLSISCTPYDSPVLTPSIEISDQSNYESLSDTIVTEEEVPCSSNELSDVPTAELSQSETHPVPILDGDLSPPLEHDPRPLFVIDTTPTVRLPHRSASDVILVDRAGHGETLGEDDEQIVYVAPHPRSGRISPSHSPVKPSQLTGRQESPIREEEGVVPANIEKEQDFLSLAALSLDPPRDAKKALRVRKKVARMQRKRQRLSKRGQMGFGAFGAIMSEAQLREEDAAERQRPTWATRRRGDSDLDWGTEDQDKTEDGVDALSDGLGGMAIDVDLDVNAMHGFLKSMSMEGSRFVTMDDIEDEARLQQEDEGEGGPNGSSDSELSDDDAVEDDDEEAVFNVEEKILIAESDGEALSPDSDEDEGSPRSSFQARLRKVRERAARPQAIAEISDDEEDVPWTRCVDDVARIHVSPIDCDQASVSPGAPGYPGRE